MGLSSIGPITGISLTPTAPSLLSLDDASSRANRGPNN